MDVTRRDDRLMKLITELYDRFIEFLKLLDRFYCAVVEHEHVVADRLDFQIIVEGGDFLKLPPLLARYNRAEQLARLAGAADKQPLAVLYELRFGNTRLFVEVIEMRHGNQLIKVFQSRLVFHENNLVVGGKLAEIRAVNFSIDLLNEL